MCRAYRYLGSLFLAGALLAPLAINAGAQGQERKEERREQKEKHKRFYDRDRKDWHDWDDREDRAYRQWLTERRWEFREFGRQSSRRQRDFWRWRHDHPDRDR